MLKLFKSKKINAEFYLAGRENIRNLLKKEGSFLKFIWVREGILNLDIDGTRIRVADNQIVCCTYLQRVTLLNEPASANLLMFNREFYCIHTFDEEVSCNGLLFFGSNYTPVLTLDESELFRISTLIDVLEDEFDIIDGNQEEMLRILLKRFIIRCTRLARIQLTKNSISTKQIDNVRKFNALVEEHYKEKKRVSDYAELLNRSPKTLTNLFTKFSEKSPLQIILDRVLLESKRPLIYTDKSSKEISNELGFEDQSGFSKFFKKQSGITASKFREKYAINQL